MASYDAVADVVISGLGISGASLNAILARSTNVKRVIAIEKNSGAAEVNSDPNNNAQTPHDGGTETNYNLAHALEVKEANDYLMHYLLSRPGKGLFEKLKYRMVLGVGPKEVATLEKRFAEFKKYYPDLRLIYTREIANLEPKIIEGRDLTQAVAALVSSNAYAVDYQKTAKSFLEDAKGSNKNLQISFNEKIEKVSRRPDGMFVIETDKRKILAKVFIAESGPYSLLFAQELGYGKDLGILPVAGSFCSVEADIEGKIYRVQVEGRPFAELHLDKDIRYKKGSRCGPTTKPLPLMERHHYKTFFDFIKLPIVSLLGIVTLIKIIFQNDLLGYGIKNMIFDIPLIGKFFFLREIRAIIPTLKYRDLKLRKGAGGIRPQIVNLKTSQLEMGDKTLVGDNCIFNTTPSPGASVCLKNAKRDAKKIVEMLGSKYYFDEWAFEHYFGKSKTCQTPSV